MKWAVFISITVLVLSTCTAARRWFPVLSTSSFNSQLRDNSTENSTGCSIKIEAPLQTNVVLTDVNFAVKVTLPPFFQPDYEPVPDQVFYAVFQEETGKKVTDGVYNRTGDGPTFIFNIDLTIDSSGSHNLLFDFSTEPFTEPNNTLTIGELFCPTQTVNFMAIPGPVTLLPPILTAVIAIVFRQVLIALLLGIWLCAFFAYRYNPLIATLRTIDYYFVNSVADFDHSAIAVFSFFLGGLIGVVQKSGGGLGLAAILKKLTGSRRRASIVCIILGAMIFFDDYSLVLIAGTSLRTMMDAASVSKEKFAYILKSLGPTLPSIVPISSWIGVQVGNLHQALQNPMCHDSCENLRDMDPFVLAVRTIPYRFFPLLLVFTIIFITILKRDFGPMLWAERDMLPKSPPNLINTKLPGLAPNNEKLKKNGLKNGLVESQIREEIVKVEEEGEHETLEMKRTTGSNTDLSEADLPGGTLAPKKGVKYRWFNAAIPFLVTMIVTLVGMVLDGWQTIINMPEDKKPQLTIVNIFTNADSVAALIWASALACVVAMVMLLIQRILTLNEYMEAWIAGVNDIIEPFMVLWLAWALGEAIQDIHTTNYLAKALSDGGLTAQYIPAIVTVIGFLMSFAAGSAFGTMGIIFPLVIPTVCQLSNCNEDAVLQSSAAILASSLFGNVISPIAGICILTVFASQCPLVNHIKSAALYAIIVAVISVVFGALPVGAGWYPWYAGWIIQIFLVVVIFGLFSSNIDSVTSRPLLQRLCPQLYAAPGRLIMMIKKWWLSSGCRIKCQRSQRVCKYYCCCHYCKKDSLPRDVSEHSPLLS